MGRLRVVGVGRVVGVARLGLQLVDARVRHVGDLRHGEQVVAAETTGALPAVTVPVEPGELRVAVGRWRLRRTRAV